MSEFWFCVSSKCSFLEAYSIVLVSDLPCEELCRKPSERNVLQVVFAIVGAVCDETLVLVVSETLDQRPPPFVRQSLQRLENDVVDGHPQKHVNSEVQKIPQALLILLGSMRHTQTWMAKTNEQNESNGQSSS